MKKNLLLTFMFFCTCLSGWAEDANPIKGVKLCFPNIDFPELTLVPEGENNTFKGELNLSGLSDDDVVISLQVSKDGDKYDNVKQDEISEPSTLWEWNEDNMVLKHSNNDFNKYNVTATYDAATKKWTLTITGITDEEISITCDKDKLEFPATAGDLTVNLTANAAWTATSAEDWITVDPDSGEAGQVSVKITVKENTAPGTRTGIVTFTAKDGDNEKSVEVEVTQEGVELSIECEQTALNVPAAGKEQTVNLTSHKSILRPLSLIKMNS